MPSSLISIAAPVYLAKGGQRGGQRPRNVVIAAMARLGLLAPAIGSFNVVPPYPTDTFP